MHAHMHVYIYTGTALISVKNSPRTLTRRRNMCVYVCVVYMCVTTPRGRSLTVETCVVCMCGVYVWCVYVCNNSPRTLTHLYYTPVANGATHMYVYVHMRICSYTHAHTHAHTHTHSHKHVNRLSHHREKIPECAHLYNTPVAN